MYVALCFSNNYICILLYIFQYDILSHLLKEEKDQGTVYMKREHYERRGTPKKLKWVSVGIARGKKEIKKKNLEKFCVPHSMTYARYMLKQSDVMLVFKMHLKDR